jgi:hypothetical protein
MTLEIKHYYKELWIHVIGDKTWQQPAVQHGTKLHYSTILYLLIILTNKKYHNHIFEISVY